MRLIGLEPTRLATPDPKSGASTTFAASAFRVANVNNFCEESTTPPNLSFPCDIPGALSGGEGGVVIKVYCAASYFLATEGGILLSAPF